MTSSSSSRSDVTVREVQPGDAEALGVLFVELAESGDERYFHPHPLTVDTAQWLAKNYAGSDIYLVAELVRQIVGYGMLRGWDEGYSVPSLGIAVDRRFRGQGIGIALMHSLHLAALRRGAQEVRLKVAIANVAAIALYRRMGYEFEEGTHDELIGHVVLGTSRGLPSGLSTPRQS